MLQLNLSQVSPIAYQTCNIVRVCVTIFWRGFIKDYYFWDMAPYIPVARKCCCRGTWCHFFQDQRFCEGEFFFTNII